MRKSGSYVPVFTVNCRAFRAIYELTEQSLDLQDAKCRHASNDLPCSAVTKSVQQCDYDPQNIVSVLAITNLAPWCWITAASAM